MVRTWRVLPILQTGLEQRAHQHPRHDSVRGQVQSFDTKVVGHDHFVVEDPGGRLVIGHQQWPAGIGMGLPPTFLLDARIVRPLVRGVEEVVDPESITQHSRTLESISPQVTEWFHAAHREGHAVRLLETQRGQDSFLGCHGESIPGQD